MEMSRYMYMYKIEQSAKYADAKKWRLPVLHVMAVSFRPHCSYSYRLISYVP